MNIIKQKIGDLLHDFFQFDLNFIRLISNAINLLVRKKLTNRFIAFDIKRIKF